MSAYRSNRRAVEALLGKAIDGGLIAAATVYVNAVKRGLRGGYTSGAFVTGALMASVTRTEPRNEGVARVVRVGTNVMYAVFWELGHHNLFSRRYERKEVWMPELIRSAPAQRAAFQRVFERMMGGGFVFGGGGEAAD